MCQKRHPIAVNGAGRISPAGHGAARNISSAAGLKAVDGQLIDELVGRAQAEGLQLTGEGGLLQQLTTAAGVRPGGRDHRPSRQ